MGLFGNGKGRERRIKRRDDRKAKRQARKLQRRQQRHDNRLERANSRQQTRLTKQQMKSEADLAESAIQSNENMEAINAGINPYEYDRENTPKNSGSGVGSQIAGGIGSILGGLLGRNRGQDDNDSPTVYQPQNNDGLSALADKLSLPKEQKKAGFMEDGIMGIPAPIVLLGLGLAVFGMIKSQKNQQNGRYNRYKGR